MGKKKRVMKFPQKFGNKFGNKLSALFNTEVEQEVVEERLIENKGIAFNERPPSSSFASPGVRRLARELEINLAMIKGTGRKGRLTKQDLHSYIKLRMSTGSGTITAPKKEIDFSRWGEIDKQKLTKINKFCSYRYR